MGTHADNFLAWVADGHDAEDYPENVLWSWSEQTRFLEPKLVHEEEGDQRRWSQWVTQVFEFADGSLVEGGYDRGLTENQENEFERGPDAWRKVQAYTETITVTKYRGV